MADVLHDQIGEVLLRQGTIQPTQLAEALAFQRERPFMHLGEILLGLGAVSFMQLCEALEQQYRSMRLGQILVRGGHLSQEQVQQALERQVQTGEMLGDLIVGMGLAPAEVVRRALEYQRAYDEFTSRNLHLGRRRHPAAEVVT